MNFQAQSSTGLPPISYYAPTFKVEVEGRELDPEIAGDVLDLKVTLDMDNMSSADIVFRNWDERRVAFKYSDAALLDLGNRVHVQMGYADRILSILNGQINHLSPCFPQSGLPTLAVGVLDGMQLLKNRKPVEGEATKFTQKTDWQIAEIIAQRNGLASEVTREGEMHAEVVQKNQDDARFLMERAKRIDFDCYIYTKYTEPGRGTSVLRFVKPTDGRQAGRLNEFVFRWGETLLSFAPSVALSDQVSRLTVRGWDSRTKQVIEYTASASDLPGPAGDGTSGPAAAQDSLGGRQEVVVDMPVMSEQEARNLAISLLNERAYDFATGSGEVMGLPDLRPGDNVRLESLGKRYSGSYYVKEVEHRIRSAAYTTKFKARRVYDEGLEGS